MRQRKKKKKDIRGVRDRMKENRHKGDTRRKGGCREEKKNNIKNYDKINGMKRKLKRQERARGGRENGDGEDNQEVWTEEEKEE